MRGKRRHALFVVGEMNQGIDSIVLIVDSRGKLGPLLSLNTCNIKPWNLIFSYFRFISIHLAS